MSYLNASLIKELKVVVGTLKLNEPMRLHTSFRIGGPADCFIIAKDHEELRRVVQILKENGIAYILLGGGTNMLVCDGGIRGVVIRLGKGFKWINRRGRRLWVGGAAKLGVVVYIAQNEGLSGLEFAFGIPGTIGGAISVNASAFGSSFRFIVREEIYLEDTEIIVGAELELKEGSKDKIESNGRENLAVKKKTQPFSLRSAGCIFKNPEGRFASQLIDEAGLKGMRVGGAYVSSKHANFIINRGDARASDVLYLIEIIKERVEGLFGIRLEPEINIIGEEII